MISQAAVLGVVQGLSEFLPISSSGHLILTRWFFGWDNVLLSASQTHQFAAAAGVSDKVFGDRLDKVFDLALHLGTAIAVIVYFRNDLLRLLMALFSNDPEKRADKRLAIGIIIGCIPAALAGKFFEETFDELFRAHIWFIGSALIVFGVLLWIADRFFKKTRDIEQLGMGDAAVIGCAQALALAPGVSRSGITMTLGMMIGLKREAAARFSFLLMAPIVLGGAIYKLSGLRHLPPGALKIIAPSMIVGVITSAVVGAFCIAFLLQFLRRNSMLPFAVYRVLMGIAVIVIYLQRPH